MAKKFRGMPKQGGMPNMQGLMKQAKKMQEELEKAQKQLEDSEYTATSGGGAVTIKMTGKGELVDIKLDQAVVDPDDIEMLQDLIIAAHNDAKKQIDSDSDNRMSSMTGGMNIPGLF